MSWEVFRRTIQKVLEMLRTSSLMSKTSKMIEFIQGCNLVKVRKWSVRGRALGCNFFGFLKKYFTKADIFQIKDRFSMAVFR